MRFVCFVLKPRNQSLKRSRTAAISTSNFSRIWPKKSSLTYLTNFGPELFICPRNVAILPILHHHDFECVRISYTWQKQFSKVRGSPSIKLHSKILCFSRSTISLLHSGSTWRRCWYGMSHQQRCSYSNRRNLWTIQRSIATIPFMRQILRVNSR